MKKDIFFAVLMLAVFTYGCASMAYTWYGIVPSQGKLLGPTPKDDLPITVCEPDAQAQGKCVVLMAAEWEKVQRDIAALRVQLKACQNP